MVSAVHQIRSRFCLSNFFTSLNGKQLMTSPRVNQPLRAISIPNQRSCRLRTECASGLMAHRTPCSLASFQNRQSISNRRGFAFNSMNVPVLGGRFDDFPKVHLVRLPRQQQAPGRMAQDRYVSVFHCANDAPRHLFLRQRERSVHAGNDVIQLSQNLIRKVQVAVLQNVAFDAGENLELGFEPFIQFADLFDLLQQPLFVQSMGLKGTLLWSAMPRYSRPS